MQIQLEANTNPAELFQRVEARLYEFLNPLIGGKSDKGWGFGRDLFTEDILAVVQAIDGVDYVRDVMLYPVDFTDHQFTVGKRHNQIQVPEGGLVCSYQHIVSSEKLAEEEIEAGVEQDLSENATGESETEHYAQDGEEALAVHTTDAFTLGKIEYIARPRNSDDDSSWLSYASSYEDMDDVAKVLPRIMSSWMQFLPEIYKDAEFMGRYLLIFEAAMKPTKWQIDHNELYLSPETMPLDWIQWILGWFDMPIPTDLPEDRQRSIYHDLENSKVEFRDRFAESAEKPYVLSQFDTADDFHDSDDNYDTDHDF